MEWFDFASFGAFADIIGKEFFPDDYPELQLLKTMSIFGAAFVMRPLGGIIMGWIGDTVGRQRALEISIALMLLPSFLIGCLPSYHIIGWYATAALVFLRLLQGIAVGGELVGAFIYTIEATGGMNRGFWGGACKATGNFGTSLGMGTAVTLRYVLTPEQLLSWGWRVPFLMGIVFGTAGLLLRNSLKHDQANIHGGQMGEYEYHEHGQEQEQYSLHFKSSHPLSMIPTSATTTPSPTHSSSPSKPPSTATNSEETESSNTVHPTIAVLQTHWQSVLLVSLVAAFWGCGYYSVFVWMAYFMADPQLVGDNPDQHDQQFLERAAWGLIFFANLLLVVGLPLAGLLGDRVGEAMCDADRGMRCVMKLGLLLMMLLAVPAFMLISYSSRIGSSIGGGAMNVLGAAVGELLLLTPVALFGANLPAFMVAQFPPHRRFSGVGIAYNLAHAVFSSTSPLIQTSLVLSTPPTSQANPGSRFNLLMFLLYDGRSRPAYYLMAIAVMSFATIYFGVDVVAFYRYKQQLRLTEIMSKAQFPRHTRSRMEENEAADDDNSERNSLMSQKGILGTKTSTTTAGLRGVSIRSSTEERYV